MGRKKCTPGIDRFLHLIFMLKRKTDKPAGKVGFDWRGATEGTPQRKEVGDWSLFFDSVHLCYLSRNREFV